MKSAAVWLLTGALWCQTGPAIHADAAVIATFQKRVNAYLELRREVESKIGRLKPTDSPEKISRHEQHLRQGVRQARKGAREGDVFTPDIATEIRRLIALAMMGGNAQKVDESLRHAEPVQIRLQVNDAWPARVPIQSTPPSLLANLPMLPMEIEYRIAGRDLVLLDAKANLAIDLIRGVFS